LVKFWKSFILFLIIIISIFGLNPPGLNAQNNDLDEYEVYLNFRYRGIIKTVVISYYKNDEFYLPVSELFSLFSIEHSIDGLVIQGEFGIDRTPYTIDLKQNIIKFDNSRTKITVNDFLVKEIDSYLRADLFYQAFGLNFSIDFNNLTLSLETDRELPAIQQAIRQQRRELADSYLSPQIQYDLRYDRERPFLDGGFLDYNLSTNITPNSSVYNLNTSVGLQVYGGDLQGAIFGSYSNNFTTFGTDNLRWRYMYRDTKWLSKIVIGQTTTDGFSANSYTGIRLTNDPIEPRLFFDEYEVQGETIPQSEVELYMNNALIDFQQSDELGNYRFLTPITYGSSQLNLKIYGPTGQIIERSQRIQVPFTFQPEGVFHYTLNAGRLDNPIFGKTTQDYTAQVNGAYGITEWLTAKGGVEYYQGYHNRLPTFTSSLSSRIASNYIFTVEAASQAYYRGLLNVIYANSASFNIDYTNFTEGFSIYNPSNDDKRLVASVFYPFKFWGLPFNLRASTFSKIRNSSRNLSTFRLDANSRLGKLNLRIGYSDQYSGKIDLLNPTETAYLETSATYSLSRNRNFPPYLRGVFLRAQMRYQPTVDEFDSAELLISRNVFQRGRFQLSFGRNFNANYNTLRFSLVVELNKARSSSTFNNIRGNNNFTQNIRGSIGYDSNYQNFIFTSRNQVGRSGAAIQLFVDNNNNGSFDDGDDPIKGNAVRVKRSGATSTTKNGVLYYTQMQPYFYYNMEMNKANIQNPMLVPEFEKFGLITDPNRFKKVEIPFYMSGVMEGMVERLLESGSKTGVSGLRVFLTSEDGDVRKEIRTFSDGSFYDYEIPPGKYVLEVDSTQLNILNRKSIPAKLEFEVKAIPEGDFVEGLSFLLVPIPKEEPESTPPTNLGTSQTTNSGGGVSIGYSIAVDSLAHNQCRYRIQLGSYNNISDAKNILQNYDQGAESYIIHNEPINLYAVRTGLFQEWSKASEFLTEIAPKYPYAAVVNQCNETNTTNFKQSGIRFELELATFSTAEQANSYKNNLRHQLAPDSLSTYDDPESQLFKVLYGPFNTIQSAQKVKNKIINSTAIADILIAKREAPAQIINANFKYLLQLGEFESTRKASLYALRIEEEYSLKSKILIDEREQVILVLEGVFTDFDKIVNTRKQIMNNSNFKTPIIHLMEKKFEESARLEVFR
jgi:outer membrane usher protein FimD/PapC/cell division septation protein DedD